MSTELVEIEESTVLQVFSSENGLDPVIQQVKDIVDGFEHDLSTAAARKKTASLSHKVAKLKTRLDGMGKDLVSEWKTKAKAVDKSRKDMRESLDSLRDEARQPLTDWESEQTRIEEEARIAEDAKILAAQIESDHEIALLLDEKFERELWESKENARIEEEARLDRIAKEQAENEERIAKEAAESARKEAEKKAIAEQQRVEKERKEAIQREEQAKQQALEAERAKIAAEERAKIQAEEAEKRRIQAEQQAKAYAEEAAKRAQQAEIDRQAIEQAEIRAEQDRREANKRHVGKIRKKAKESLMEFGLNEKQAKAIVMAINAGQIPRVSISY